MTPTEEYLEPFKGALSRTRDPDMKFIHKFLGFGIHKSECQVEIWFQDDRAIVVFTDTNKGTSVTNASEQIITEVYNQYLAKFPVSKVLFCETYDKVKDGIDWIEPTWTPDGKGGLMVHDVEWHHLGKIVKQ